MEAAQQVIKRLLAPLRLLRVAGVREIRLPEAGGSACVLRTQYDVSRPSEPGRTTFIPNTYDAHACEPSQDI